MQANEQLFRTIFKSSGMICLSVTTMLILGCSTSSLYRAVTNNEPEKVNAKVPLRQLNPHPQHAYEVQILLNQPPSTFEYVTGGVHFGVENLQCGKVNPLTGLVPRINSTESFEVKKISDVQYTGIFYTDMILDQDYYKNGVCKWRFDGISIALTNVVNEQTAGYSIFLSAEAIQKNTSHTQYYWNGYYKPSGTLPQFISSGRESLDNVSAEKKPEYFSMTINAQQLK